MSHSVENDVPRCPNCGAVIGDSHPSACLVNAAREIERLRGRTGPRTHGGNHAPLPEGAYLAPGFCDECDRARVFPPGEGGT